MTLPLPVPEPEPGRAAPESGKASPAPRVMPALPGRGVRPPGGGPGIGIASARIAVMMLLATETMLFAGLVGAYLLLRYGSAVAWPPAGQPRLPIGVTTANTAVLLASALAYFLGLRAIRRGEAGRLRNALLVTAVLGCTFLLVQGSEWVRLIGHGLTLQSSVYGATFYLLIGVHGLHVLAGVGWLLAVLFLAQRGRYTRASHLGVELCAMYWYYVSAMWIVLFAIVYVA